MALSIALSEEGRALFDNFVPCVRRGIVDYRNSDKGRRVTFSGCDLGDGVVVDGSGEIAWAESAGSERRRFCEFGQTPLCQSTMDWSGTLTVSVGSDSTFQITAFEADSISLEPPGGLSPFQGQIEAGDIGFSGMVVLLDGYRAPVTDAGLPADVFGVEAGLSLETLPNPSRSVSALTEADLKRLLYGLGTDLASVLFGETLETQRGDHGHVLECGSLEVEVLESDLPRIESHWEACDLIPGLILDGNLTLEWSEPDFSGSGLTMRGTGDLEVGGGVPTVHLKQLEWSVVGQLAGEVTLSGSFFDGVETRTFSLTLVLDD